MNWNVALRIAAQAIVSAAMFVALVACGHSPTDCVSSEVDPIAAISVVDDVTGVPVCDATVIVTNGNFSETLPSCSYGSDASCSYCLGTGPGNEYVVSVTAPSFGAGQGSFDVVYDSCDNVEVTARASVGLVPQ
jgi:hypothetical protein